MPNKTVISNFNVMEDNVTLIYDTRSISTVFKIFFSSLAESLFVKLPIPPGKYNLEFALNYYFTFTTPDDFVSIILQKSLKNNFKKSTYLRLQA